MISRLNLLNNLIDNAFIIKSGNDGFYFLDCSNVKEINIKINENVKANVLLSNIKKETKIKIDLADDSSLSLKSVLKDELHNLNIDANLQKNSDIQVHFADFTNGNNNVKVNINLLKEGAKAYWHLASLSAGNDNKEFDVSLLHDSLNTFGISDNYGVSKDDARLIFSGVSTIKNGAKGSNTRQNAKIMVFDENSKGIAKPVFKIDENEIAASHGASVGKISDDTMFYLTSRGLSQDEAKHLITMGYLKPILDGFEEEEIKDEISSLIEERM